MTLSIKKITAWLVLLAMLTLHIELCTYSMNKYSAPGVFLGLSFIIILADLIDGLELIKLNSFILLFSVNLVTSIYTMFLATGIQINSVIPAVVALLPALLVIDDSFKPSCGIKYWRDEFKKQPYKIEPIDHFINPSK